MPRVRRVKYTEEHRDYMSTWNEGGVPIIPAPTHVFELHIAGTTLVFKDPDQLRQARDFFVARTRRPTTGPNPPCEHYWHIWYGRLPKQVLKRTNREKILKSLVNAIAEFGGSEQSHGEPTP